jgi:hypothetical protein
MVLAGQKPAQAAAAAGQKKGSSGNRPAAGKQSRPGK